MTCFLCKNEWCWECKQDFPVHTPQCAFYFKYLDILEFQGIEAHPEDGWGWYSIRGNSGPFIFVAFLLLIVIFVLPSLIIVNILITPCYLLMMIRTCCKNCRSCFKRWYCITMMVILGVFLYIGAPVIFLILTIPQIVIFAGKLIFELKDLIKNRCRRYKRLSVSPIMNRYFDALGII